MDFCEQIVSVTTHGIGVTLGFAVFVFGQRSLRDQCTHAGFVGFFGQVGQLLVGDGQIRPDRFDAVGHVSESSFDEGSAHGPSVTTTPDHNGPMTTDDRTAPVDWGIEGGYRDGLGQWRSPDAEVTALLQQTMGRPSGDPLVVIRPGDVVRLGPGDLILEDGSAVAVDDLLPADLILGYHRHEGPFGATNVIVSPGRCHLPAELHTWGVTAQLYAVRSSTSWGIGDLGDLRRLVDWARERQAGVVGLNPLHAPTPHPHPADSPYSPSSRRFRDPLYLAMEDVPGAAAVRGWADVVQAGRTLSAGGRIDRSAVWAHKRRALEQIWADRVDDQADGFGPFRATGGDDLKAWGTFCALADHHGSGWLQWPDEHRRPDHPSVARFARDNADQIGFWCWLQWLLDTQLSDSGAGDVVIADLAGGFAADGFDAWQWQDLLADGVRIGAPPDPLGREGQDWGLPPFVPWRLRDAAYQPFAATIRAVLRHARGLRVDHVMGLFRLLWVPPGRGAVDGAYVRFAGREMLDVLALESVRAGALVVGEDLGTVEPGVRETLAAAGVLSTRLLWFEEEPTELWPRQAMAAVSTHDLPTLAGVWSGVDLVDQHAAGVTVPPDGDQSLRHRLQMATSMDDDANEEDVAVGAHRRLGASPSMVVTATLDDLTGAEHRPNLPGTIDEHPNWRVPLPVLLDDLDGLPRAEAIAAALRR